MKSAVLLWLLYSSGSLASSPTPLLFLLFLQQEEPPPSPPVDFYADTTFSVGPSLVSQFKIAGRNVPYLSLCPALFYSLVFVTI